MIKQPQLFEDLLFSKNLYKHVEEAFIISSSSSLQASSKHVGGSQVCPWMKLTLRDEFCYVGGQVGSQSLGLGRQVHEQAYMLISTQGVWRHPSLCAVCVCVCVSRGRCKMLSHYWWSRCLSLWSCISAVGSERLSETCSRECAHIGCCQFNISFLLDALCLDKWLFSEELSLAESASFQSLLQTFLQLCITTFLFPVLFLRCLFSLPLFVWRLSKGPCLSASPRLITLSLSDYFVQFVDILLKTKKPLTLNSYLIS